MRDGQHDAIRQFREHLETLQRDRLEPRHFTWPALHVRTHAPLLHGITTRQ